MFLSHAITSSLHVIVTHFGLGNYIMRQFFLVTFLRCIIVTSTLDASGPQLQPDLYLPAVLPANFSIRPSYWEHSTPLLQHCRPSDQLLRRADSVTQYWNGWQSLQYLFVLCAVCPSLLLLADQEIAATRILLQISASQKCSRTRRIHSAIQPIQVLPPQMDQISSTS